MTNQHSPEVQGERQQVDISALLATAIDHLACLHIHAESMLKNAENESSWMRLYIEADACLEEIEGCAAALEAAQELQSHVWYDWRDIVKWKARQEARDTAAE